MLENNQKQLILLQDLGMLYPKETSNQKYRFGLYKCYCGNEFKASLSNIKNNNIKSCGCLKKELIAKRNKLNSTTHGLTTHRLYNTWNNIINRCNNQKSKDYKNYGGRGIKVCDRWLNVENFINDMFPSYKNGLSIDRENNDLGYSKDNCRWATKEVQHRNTRKIRKSNTSGYRGVSFYKSNNKWAVRINVNKKDIHLGYYDNPINGALAYDKYIIDNNLEHTKNFEY